MAWFERETYRNINNITDEDIEESKRIDSYVWINTTKAFLLWIGISILLILWTTCTYKKASELLNKNKSETLKIFRKKEKTYTTS